jgi:hypothetical protein
VVSLTFSSGGYINGRNSANLELLIDKTSLISMLEFLIDNIFVFFGGTLFQQIVGIPMGTNCAPLLADLFFINGRNSANLELLIDKTSSIYLYVKLKALAS